MTLDAAWAVGIATVRDTARRPGYVLAVLATGALLAVLPRLTNPAAGAVDNARLAVELSVSTLTLAMSVTAGVLGARGLSRTEPAGWMLEMHAAPVRPGELVCGRWLGAVLASLLLGIGGTAAGALGWLGRIVPDGSDDATALAAVAGAGAGTVALSAALGALYAALAPGELALFLVVAHLAATRALGGLDLGAGDWIRVLVPDPGRVDVARALAFGLPCRWADVGCGIAACATQAAAILLWTSGVLRTRRS